MLPFHATNEKLACTNHGWQLEPIEKNLPLEFFFVKNIYATPMVHLFHQLSYFYIPRNPPQKVSLNYLIMFQLISV